MNEFDQVLCVIPARGGSKEIPGKNLRPVGGKPLVVHSIEHAINAEIPRDKIIVSSDSDQILELASGHGVVALRRPDDISGDDSSTESALLHALDLHPADHVILLQPTSPIRFKNTIKDCLFTYLRSGGHNDSLVTATKFYDFIWRSESRHDWKWHSSYLPRHRPMRQRMLRNDILHFENGNIYITSARVLQETNCRIGSSVCVYPISEIEGLQIDTIEDLKIVDDILSGKVSEL